MFIFRRRNRLCVIIPEGAMDGYSNSTPPQMPPSEAPSAVQIAPRWLVAWRSTRLFAYLRRRGLLSKQALRWTALAFGVAGASVLVQRQIVFQQHQRDMKAAVEDIARQIQIDSTD